MIYRGRLKKEQKPTGEYPSWPVIRDRPQTTFAISGDFDY